MNMHQRIAHARKAAGLSQSDVATHLSISRAAVNLWEAEGERATTPEFENLKKFAVLTATPLSWLLSGEGPEHQFTAWNLEENAKIPIKYGIAFTDADGTYIKTPLEGEYMDIPVVYPDVFALRVENNMAAPVLRDGWFVLANPARKYESGDLVLFRESADDETGRVAEFLYNLHGRAHLAPLDGSQQRFSIDHGTVHCMAMIVAILPPSMA